ncbi:MAG: phytanoyl-CoA dioxygenase family protein [Myxococcota bacterium]
MGEPRLEFDAFHREALPERLAQGNGALAHALAARLGPLGIQLRDGRGVTYTASGEGLAIDRGCESARTVVEIDHEDWRGLAADLDSGPGLLYSKRGRVLRGSGAAFLEWESGWRAMYHGRPIFDPADRASEGLVDRDGAPLDPTRTFRLDSDPADRCHFMQQAGFVLVREVFSKDEVERFWRASEELKAAAVEGDGGSWWAKDSEGCAVLGRVLDGSGQEAFADLHLDPRLAGLVAEIEPELEPNLDAGDFASVLYKNPGVVEGLSDLPWHRDCGMGGHARMCPTINLSIFLSEATDASGALKVLPGSHRGSVPAIDATHERAPAGVPVAAGPGDVSLHYGDVMHAAPPPTGDGPFRRSAVLTWKPPGAKPHTGERHYNDVLLADSEDGQVPDIQRVLAGD